MSDENELPKTWGDACDEAAEWAAKELGCAVVVIALQTAEQGGKICAAHGGIKGTDSPLAELVESPAKLLGSLAALCAMEEGMLPADFADKLPKPGKPLTVVYPPGWDAGSNLSPDEMAELKNQIERAVASGELQANARRLSPEEAEELERQHEEALRALGSSATPQ